MSSHPPGATPPAGAGSPHGPGAQGPPGSHLPVWMQRVHVPGGIPTKNPDIPITAVFLVLFFLFAVGHVRVFVANKKRGHLFVFNMLCMALCMCRVVTCALRLAWVKDVENRGLALAATVFVAAGVLILYIVNLLFSQRIVRGMHPRIGWSKGFSIFFKIIYILIPFLLAMVVTASVQLFFTTDNNISRIDLDLQRTASTFFTFISFLPIPITILALVLPGKRPDNFGLGSWTRKSAVLLIASTLLCLGSTFRTATAFISQKPSFRTNPPWWSAKWCFYFFQFTVEILVIILYLALRIDKLFHVPDGAAAPGDYTNFKYRKSHAPIIEHEEELIERDAAGIRYGTPEMFHRDFQIELQRRNSTDSTTSTIAPSIAPSRIGEKVEVFRREVELGTMDVEEAASILDINPKRMSRTYEDSAYSSREPSSLKTSDVQSPPSSGSEAPLRELRPPPQRYSGISRERTPRTATSARSSYSQKFPQAQWKEI